MPAVIRSGMLAIVSLLMTAQITHAQAQSFGDLLNKAKAQAAEGHRWTPPGDNMSETVMRMMSLIPTATPAELSEFSALLEKDKGMASTSPPHVKSSGDNIISLAEPPPMSASKQMPPPGGDGSTSGLPPAALPEPVKPEPSSLGSITIDPAKPDARSADAKGKTLSALLEQAKAQAAAGHRWTPPGDNMSETVMRMMSLIPTATPHEIGELSALLESNRPNKQPATGRSAPNQKTVADRTAPASPSSGSRNAVPTAGGQLASAAPLPDMSNSTTSDLRQLNPAPSGPVPSDPLRLGSPTSDSGPSRPFAPPSATSDPSAVGSVAPAAGMPNPATQNPKSGDGRNRTFSDLLKQAKAQVAAGHRWAPAGDNMSETVMHMMDLISTATPSELEQLAALLKDDSGKSQPKTADSPQLAKNPQSKDLADLAVPPALATLPPGSESSGPVAGAPLPSISSIPDPSNTPLETPGPELRKPAASRTANSDPAQPGPVASVAAPPNPATPDKARPDLALASPAASNPLPPVAALPGKTQNVPATMAAPASPAGTSAPASSDVTNPGPSADSRPPSALPGAMKSAQPAAGSSTPTLPPANPRSPTLASRTPLDTAPGRSDPITPRPAMPAQTNRAALLFARGLDAERRGDVSGARRYYASAAEQGDATAARNLGRLYDPAFLGQTALGGIDHDAALARHWYERAISLGDPEARPLLEALSTR